MLFLAGLFMFLALIATNEIENKDTRSVVVMFLMVLVLIFTIISSFNIGYEAAVLELQSQN